MLVMNAANKDTFTSVLFLVQPRVWCMIKATAKADILTLFSEEERRQCINLDFTNLSSKFHLQRQSILWQWFKLFNKKKISIEWREKKSVKLLVQTLLNEDTSSLEWKMARNVSTRIVLQEWVYGLLSRKKWQKKYIFERLVSTTDNHTSKTYPC